MFFVYRKILQFWYHTTVRIVSTLVSFIYFFKKRVPYVRASLFVNNSYDITVYPHSMA
jgi:hypothetical protein